MEGALRGVALAALVAALLLAWWSTRQRDAQPSVAIAADGGLSPVARDSFAALARAGRALRWSGTVAALTLAAEPSPEPGRRWRVAAVADTAMAAFDSLGPLDSLPAAGSLTLDQPQSYLGVTTLGTAARAATRQRAEPRRVLVLGRAGYEPRFTITALEEAGWEVDARLTLGRGREVRQGNPTLSLARHGLVIAFDSSLVRAQAAALARFVREGGGLILADDAVAAPAVQALLPGRVLAQLPPEVRSFDEGHPPTHALALQRLGRLRDDALMLETREDDEIAVAARRVGAGRVLQLGYRETWRWRMEGEAGSVAAHRAFWRRLAAATTAATLTADAVPSPLEALLAIGDASSAAPTADPAPRAAIVHALGAPGGSAPVGESRGPGLPRWLGPLILLALLGEWGSRRARGAA